MFCSPPSRLYNQCQLCFPDVSSLPCSPPVFSVCTFLCSLSRSLLLEEPGQHFLVSSGGVQESLSSTPWLRHCHLLPLGALVSLSSTFSCPLAALVSPFSHLLLHHLRITRRCLLHRLLLVLSSSGPASSGPAPIKQSPPLQVPQGRAYDHICFAFAFHAVSL